MEIEEEGNEGAEERAYQKELAAELAGVPFSQSKAARAGDGDGADEESDEESEDERPTSMPGETRLHTPVRLSVGTQRPLVQHAPSLHSPHLNYT
jgi:hypothetical protein